MKLNNEKLYDISFFIYLCSLLAHNGENSFFSLLTYVAFVLMIGVTIIKYRMCLKIEFATMWYGLFCLYGFASVLWAVYDRAEVFSYGTRMIQILVLCLVVPMNIRDEKDVIKTLKIIVNAVIYTGVILLVRTPISSWGTSRFGSAIGANANSLGMQTAVASLIVLFFIEIKECKLVYIPIFLFLAAIALFTGSKKAVVIILVGFFGFELLGSASQRVHVIIYRILIGIVVVAILVYLMFNNPYLYEVTGKRIERFISSFLGQYNAIDVSFNQRDFYITTAQELFVKSPIWGCGLNNFRAYTAKIEYTTVAYSHCNYWELLSCLGIIGTGIYYSMHLRIISRLIKEIKKRSPLKILMFIIMSLYIVLDYTYVSFQTVFTTIMILVIYCYTKIKHKEY